MMSDFVGLLGVFLFGIYCGLALSIHIRFDGGSSNDPV